MQPAHLGQSFGSVGLKRYKTYSAALCWRETKTGETGKKEAEILSTTFSLPSTPTEPSPAAKTMAGARAPIPPVSLPDNVVLMEDMALYAEKIDLQGMMQEYLRR